MNNVDVQNHFWIVLGSSAERRNCGVKLYFLAIIMAAMGFVLSLVCHALGWMHLDPPTGSAVFVLHIGIFPLWIPLVMLINRTVPKRTKANAEHLVMESPKWLRTAATGMMIYAFINFGLFIYSTSQYPRDQVPKWLELRDFSGHWMMFYAAAAIGFWALRKRERKQST